ncbi:flagellar biosynthesis protein FlhA [Ramlibacter sp. XY19]|uniref:flagellar biosynthesis protein FlhA n=1 Tax=Ramlibacter paludis TaxID=2908000 RepID=UPI0023DBC45E|nr:flagellar biosynthesis protein FlhA [Ramlibacter paludis]MCG2594941.1 flagellar biosynthesis protein FlhA [Ramlibacter paludis]
MNAVGRLLVRQSDAVLVLAVLGVLLVLFVPVARPLLDFLILANFAFALLILLLTFFVARPAEFSTLPSLLLVATLFRLALNVAATRLILADADAGRVIAAIGAFVVDGNVVVGLVVFLILVVVQFVVVTNGAQRVSEVAARFTLDSMPGQQMSIDADLNMGFINQAEAQLRRRTLEREAAFHGSMDGASKFVKGDAIAGITILAINIVGGLVIGIVQHHMPWGQALQTYTLLTVGDGIVTQVPALIIALGTGIIVTRSASDGNLSREALRQITAFPKTLLIVAAAMGALLLLPGIPAWPAATLLMLALAIAWLARRFGPEPTAVLAPSTGDQAKEDAPDITPVEPVEVLVGQRWEGQVQEASLFMERIGALRKQHAQEFGVMLPRIRFRRGPRLAADAYEIHIDGALVAKGEVSGDRLLAIHPAGDVRSVAGTPTRDPTYGLPALWVDLDQREAAAAARYTLVDAPTVFLTHLAEVLRRECASLLTRAETDRLLSRVRQSQPALVEEVIPALLSVGDLQKVLQNLLREKVSIRHIDAILETLADAGRSSKDAASLTEAVRQRLGHAICQGLAREGGSLQVLTLDPAIEGHLLQNLRAAQQDGRAPSFALEPKLLERFIPHLAQQAERMMKSDLLPVLLCAPELRRHLRALSERGLPHLRVLSMAEIPHTLELKSYGTITL